MDDSVPKYYRYWGKADADGAYHLLPYHCLDVAAVAKTWWNESPTIRNAFSGKSFLNPEQMQAWVLFFIALHDIGKFDIRFQRKILKTWRLLQCPSKSTRLSVADSKGYQHGTAGLCWVSLEFDEIVRGKKKDHQEYGDDFFNFGEWELDEGEDSIRRSWKPWLEAVTGHHGSLIKVENINLTPLPSECPPQYQSTDKAARKSWFLILEILFLKPVGLSLKDSPPAPPGSAFLAGFCSVSDWLGSANSEDRFSYLVSCHA